ncbi:MULTISPECIES: hypothetical protein [unclassified Burkholderia]|uniref:hypothetical protein n=1 Tax=Burkholderia TaxID=32008 RepID=UPI0014243B86|nr:MULTISPECIES: hypothetical protein [unclassified Burkholderia]NIE81894.1 hypothetical protein [Burkholderia sp. Tr-860]NIF61142.1 hypothetical protein [Burkholderia sp. Cy-647]NIF93985.1 hypothetical protein [Burkholderia sp. Ax-1720]
MNGITSTISTMVLGFRALPFIVRRILLVLGYSVTFAFGAFLHNRGVGDLAFLLLLVGGIGTFWAGGVWHLVKFGLLLALLVSRD